MSNLTSEVQQIVGAVKSLLKDPKRAEQVSMPSQAYFLEGGEVLALPRKTGDSRYPYGKDGFNFWAYASGYMHANEGLFSIFLRAAEGQEPVISFFAGFEDGKKGYVPVPLFNVPQMNDVREGVRRYTVFTPTAAYYVMELSPLIFVLRAFVTPQKEIVFSLLVENSSDTPQNFFISSYLNPFLRHQIYESGEDRWFKEIRVLKPSAAQGELGSFLVSVNEDKDRHHSITHYGVVQRGFASDKGSHLVRHEETPSRYQFVGGAQSSLHTPTSLKAGSFGEFQPVCTFVETAIVGDIVHLKLGSKGNARYDLVFSSVSDQARADALAAKSVDSAKLDACLVELEKEEAAHQAGLQARVDIGQFPQLRPAVFNSFFGHLKKQVEFCSLIKGYIQLSVNSLIGIRDVFQALEAFLFWQPGPAAKKIIEALDYTSPDGRCFRQYSLPSSTGQIGRMDLRQFIDQGCWVVSAMATYLRVTGDMALLNKVCGYHAIIDEATGKVERSSLQNSVLEHLVRITDYLVSNQDSDTKCICTLYGDWNDAIDGLGISRDPTKAFGNGVSVMATLQVYQNLHEMIEILEYVDRDKWASQISRYRKTAQEIEKGLEHYAIVKNTKGEERILHGWGDGRQYMVGSFKDPDGQARDGLTSNAFWILSGLYDKNPAKMKPIIQGAYKRLDSKYGFKTFEPYFPPDTPGVGRIGKLPEGTAENGATYVHATVFAIMSLFRIGDPKQAWEQLVKVLPFTDLHEKLSHSPFVMPNAYGFNEKKFIDGQNMNDWQTGSSNVLLKLLIRYVFGFEPALKGVWIQPAAWSPFSSFEFKIQVRGTKVILRLEDQQTGKRTFTVNGESRASTTDKIMGIEKLWIPYEEFGDGPIEILVKQ